MGIQDQGTLWEELRQATHELSPIVAVAAGEMRKLPDGAVVAQRMLEIVGMLNSLIARGNQTCGSGRMRELEELLKLKSDALLLAVHELRRPLALAEGYLSMIEEATSRPISIQLAQIISLARTGVQGMAHLVAALAEAARLEDSAQALQLHSCNLHRLAKEAIKSLQSEARAKDITVYRQMSSTRSEVTINADPEKLRTAIINLLGNAIKFAPAHSSVIVVPNVGPHTATITISDRGPGINPAEADDLFQPWRRGHDPRGGGLGLGLYIVRRIAELHGGEVKVESIPGQGATFTIRIPKHR